MKAKGADSGLHQELWESNLTETGKRVQPPPPQQRANWKQELLEGRLDSKDERERRENFWTKIQMKLVGFNSPENYY